MQVPSSGGARPHLLDACPRWVPGSGEHRLVAAKQVFFGAAGWRHTLLAPGARGPGRLDGGGLPLPGAGGRRFVVDHGRAVQLITQAQPDIVESCDPFVLGWAAREAAARLQVPAVAFCGHGMLSWRPRWAGGAWAARRVDAYLARLYAGYELVLAPSRRLVRRLRRLGVQQACHQPLGVDNQLFSPRANDPHWRRRLQERLGLPPETSLFVYAGDFGADKHLGLLADAVQRLGPGHCLIAAGAGPRPPHGRHVRLLRPPPDAACLARLLASCDVFVHAGGRDACTLPALEAMACGTPVVVGGGGALGELVDGAGLVLTSRRPAEWAEAMAACVAEPASPLSWAALERARSRDWQVVLTDLAQRYRELMRLGRQPRPEGDAAAPWPLTARSP